MKGPINQASRVLIAVWYSYQMVTYKLVVTASLWFRVYLTIYSLV